MMKMMLAAVLALAAADFIVEKDEYKTDNYTALVVVCRCYPLSQRSSLTPFGSG